ncbi:hypothetical protein HNQ60_005048 [Povalibacter uvarum]|uniref:Xaa-Pro dipeptidyl-peptidase-like domain-containing protein n=1 Tax=Povalibacter uvarum TaxID=732238 RepID=A0A841HS91_9GAMM|nr:alpha/beta hydrolase [Povalibacter uvarum]MBB6096157.1 hypothetical protein [Povalibacter uvarum]
MSHTIHRLPVAFFSQGVLLAGRLHRNVTNLTEVQPALVISGSWLTVKEQMADRHAEAFAQRGYTVLTFDFAGFGASGGEMRQTEMPARKVADIAAATQFLQTLSCVRPRIGYVAICASAQYAAAAIDAGAPIVSFASIAGWFHDTATVGAYYGGEEGIAARIARAVDALRARESGSKPDLVPAYEQGNERAGMFFPLDYYANPDRGAIPEWRNEMDEATWMYWLTFDGLRRAERLRVPTLFVHGDECALPDNVKRISQRMLGRKRMVWETGFQVDWYDRPDRVALAVDAADEHFRGTLPEGS